MGAKFTADDIALAKEVQAKYGVPASVTLGQYALESGYGQHTVGNNNYFNIKGNGTGGYRDYNSKAASFYDFGQLLSGERYTAKTGGAKTVEEYVRGVKAAGYATDPRYVSKVMSVIRANNLTQYDTGDWTAGAASVTDTATGTHDLTLLGGVVRVVLIILVILTGFVLLSVSVGTGGTSGNK